MFHPVPVKIFMTLLTYLPHRESNRRQKEHYESLFDFFLSLDGVEVTLNKKDILPQLLVSKHTALLEKVLTSVPDLDVNLVDPDTGNGMLHIFARDGNNDTFQVWLQYNWSMPQPANHLPCSLSLLSRTLTSICRMQLDRHPTTCLWLFACSTRFMERTFVDEIIPVTAEDLHKSLFPALARDVKTVIIRSFYSARKRSRYPCH